MKQTAIEFLAERYNYITWLRNRDEISASWADNLRAAYLVQAKEMEKKQTIAFGKKCFYKGFQKAENDDSNCFTAWRECVYELINTNEKFNLQIK